MNAFLGLDLGSSFCKALLVDQSGAVIATSRRPTPTRAATVDGARRVEIPIPDIEAALVDLVRALPGADLARVCAVSVTGQMHGLLVARRDLEPLRPFITWQDTRCTAGDWWEGHASRGHDRRVTGTDLRAGMLAALLPWMAAHDGLPSGPWRAGSLPDFVCSRMAGSEWVCDPANAAASGAFDLAKSTWTPRIAALADERGGPGALPPVRQSGTVLGTAGPFGLRCGLPESAAVVLGTGDFQAALLGAGHQPDELAVNVGTGAQVAVALPALATATDFETRPGALGGFLACRSGLPGGRVVQALVDSLGVPSDVLDPEAAALLGQRGAANSPLDGSAAGAGAGSAPSPPTATEKYLAELGRMADTYAAAAKSLPPARRSPLSRARLAGGYFRRSELFGRLLERALGLPVTFSAVDEQAAYGAALIARHPFRSGSV